MTLDSVILGGGGILSLVSVSLGFVALLRQKQYIDSATKKPTEVHVPGFGKMKTNYPALIFVFLGFALAFYIVHSTRSTNHDDKVNWLVKGQFKGEGRRTWSAEKLSLEQKPVLQKIDPKTGEFTFTISIPMGLTFEDMYDVIGYTDEAWSANINTKRALQEWRDGKGGSLKSAEERVRIYDTVPLVDMSK